MRPRGRVFRKKKGKASVSSREEEGGVGERKSREGPTHLVNKEGKKQGEGFGRKGGGKEHSVTRPGGEGPLTDGSTKEKRCRNGIKEKKGDCTCPRDLRREKKEKKNDSENSVEEEKTLL